MNYGLSSHMDINLGISLPSKLSYLPVSFYTDNCITLGISKETLSTQVSLRILSQKLP